MKLELNLGPKDTSLPNSLSGHLLHILHRPVAGIELEQLFAHVVAIERIPLVARGIKSRRQAAWASVLVHKNKAPKVHVGAHWTETIPIDVSHGLANLITIRPHDMAEQIHRSTPPDPYRLHLRTSGCLHLPER
jgi:hypothetical protein